MCIFCLFISTSYFLLKFIWMCQLSVSRFKVTSVQKNCAQRRGFLSLLQTEIVFLVRYAFTFSSDAKVKFIMWHRENHENSLVSLQKK
jgi:hypothetical protein